MPCQSLLLASQNGRLTCNNAALSIFKVDVGGPSANWWKMAIRVTVCLLVFCSLIHSLMQAQCF